MKNVLCFGDSNTHGYAAAADDAGKVPRFDRFTRWTGVAQQMLGGDWYVIEEGLNGRTTCLPDGGHLESERCGTFALPIALESHAPLDGVVIMLGTNDAKRRYHLDAVDIARGARTLVREVKHFPWTLAEPCPRILLVAPIELGQGAASNFMGDFDEHSVEVSKRFGACYEEVARAEGIDFLDAAAVARPADVDYIHLDESGHRALGQAIAAKLQEMLGA